MRRMISTKLADWLKKVSTILAHNDKTNTTEIGGNAEIDGSLSVNENIIIGDIGKLGHLVDRAGSLSLYTTPSSSMEVLSGITSASQIYGLRVSSIAYPTHEGVLEYNKNLDIYLMQVNGVRYEQNEGEIRLNFTGNVVYNRVSSSDDYSPAGFAFTPFLTEEQLASLLALIEN